MPFYRRTVGGRRARPGAPVAELRDVCSLGTVTVLRQLAELCGHSLALLGDIEGHVLALCHRTGRLHRRAARLRELLRGPRHLPPAASSLDLESKKAAHAKLSWQQPVNVFLAAGRPPGMEQLHQEAQLNLQSLLQGTETTLQTPGLGAGGDRSCPTPVPSVGHIPVPPQPPSQRAAEEETDGTTALGTRSPDASLSVPTSPDKPPAWPRATPLPTVEEKQWHQSCSIQTSIVPINVS
ncbi:NHS protein, partial [Pterocles burchelli]|nr:NHS protein [Pterocles burchelli]